MLKLFAVYLGGRAKKCNTELHDVVFAVGETIESTHMQLLEQWFGIPDGLHVDSYMELDQVDGHKITLQQRPQTDTPRKLYFVNLGAYIDGKFFEAHESALLVASDEAEVKRRAKAQLCLGMTQVHTDDLYEVDDCLEISQVGPYYIHLEPIGATPPLQPNNGYFKIPKETIAAFKAQLNQ